MWDKARSRREIRRAWLISSTGDVGSGGVRLQFVFFCSTMDKIEGLVLGGQRKRRSSTGNLPGFLSGVACGLYEGVGNREYCWGREWYTMTSGERDAKRVWSVGSTGDVRRG